MILLTHGNEWLLCFMSLVSVMRGSERGSILPLLRLYRGKESYLSSFIWPVNSHVGKGGAIRYLNIEELMKGIMVGTMNVFMRSKSLLLGFFPILEGYKEKRAGLRMIVLSCQPSTALLSPPKVIRAC